MALEIIDHVWYGKNSIYPCLILGKALPKIHHRTVVMVEDLLEIQAA